MTGDEGSWLFAVVLIVCLLVTAAAGLFLGWCIWGGDDRG